MLYRYLAELPPGKQLLWCYLLWYLNTLYYRFEPTPSLWLSSVGIAIIIGIALLLATGGVQAVRFQGARRWETFRLFLIPFCVSSFSALIKGAGYWLIIPPEIPALITGTSACLAFIGLCALLRQGLSSRTLRP